VAHVTKALYVRETTIMDWTYNTIWGDQLEDGDFHNVLFEKNEKQWRVPTGSSYYIIQDFKPKSKRIDALDGLENPKYVELIRSNIQSFEGIDSLGCIKRLELHHCTKIENDEGLSSLSSDIEWLHLNTCRKFEMSDELRSLKNLKVLCLNDCAPIENLEFLSDFPNLVDFRFVGTNILDGNLRPLLDHQNLVNVGFMNKRHYNLKDTEAEEHFKPRSEAKKNYVYKDTYQTYKYDVFS